MRILLSAAIATVIVAQLPAAVVSTTATDLNILIPSNFHGVYLDFTDGNDPDALVATDTGGTPTNWDFNLFYGGARLWNSDTFQPVATDATPINATVLGLQPDDVVSNSSEFPTSFSGSSSHVGTGGTQLPSGQRGYIGFRMSSSSFQTNTPPTAATIYGYMEVTLQDDGNAGIIHSVTWETDGSQIVVVPEPGTAALAACSLAALALLRRSRQK